ncbi:MAG TPA: carbon-nitrogen hydrolase family protein [Polyangiaceae bacterium]|jgi:predicted amidohydrolase
MLRLAVAQFPVCGDVNRNLSFMVRQIRQASKAKAQLIHFPEAALTGYLSKDFSSFRGFDWQALTRAEAALAAASAQESIWLAFGSYRRAGEKPKNCVRVIAPDGTLAVTYDKIHLCERDGEKARCSAGRQLKTVRIAGTLCGFLICNDSNRVSLYQRYQALGVELLIHSYYNARSSRGKTVFDDVIVGQLRTRAFDHGFWISASNSSAKYSRLTASVAAPDGTVTGLRRHIAGIHLAEIR